MMIPYKHHLKRLYKLKVNLNNHMKCSWVTKNKMILINKMEKRFHPSKNNMKLTQVIMMIMV